MKKLQSKGFTLIELLVVIAIIGILAAIVLASLSTARSKAIDAKVQGQLDEMRNAAGVYSTTNGNYGPVNSETTGCTGGMFSDSSSGMAALASSTLSTVGSGNIDCVVSTNGATWAAAAQLPGGNTYFCVDGSGAARSAATTTGAAYTSLSTALSSTGAYCK